MSTIKLFETHPRMREDDAMRPEISREKQPIGLTLAYQDFCNR